MNKLTTGKSQFLQASPEIAGSTDPVDQALVTCFCETKWHHESLLDTHMLALSTDDRHMLCIVSHS